MTDLAELARALRASRGFAHKRDIGDAVSVLQAALSTSPVAEASIQGTPVAGRSRRPGIDSVVPLGDDCAALPDGQGGHLLFAIEGLVEDFIAHDPWFAGYCGVMVNLSDIYAMGGRPTAVVDALWSPGPDTSRAMLEGMAAAAARYGVPIVGGHTNHRSERPQLAVAVLGRAGRLLTSFDARPGDRLVMAIDLRGAFREPYPYWNASTDAPAGRLRADLELLPEFAEAGWCRAAKDISMAGAIGTALMLIECSEVGAWIDVDAIPRPQGVPIERWLTAFPSYGFVLGVPEERVGDVLARFSERELACAVVGAVDRSLCLELRRGAEREILWDLRADAFIRSARRGP